MRQINTIRYWLLIGLVFAAPVSFWPSISLPVLNFPSFRIGLYQVIAALFVISCTSLLAKRPSTPSHKQWLPRLFMILLIPTIVIGLVTTNSLSRTMLYCGSLIALIILGVCGYAVWHHLTKSQKDTLFRTLLWSGLVFGSLALVQLIIASFDPTALGTLCSGCSDQVFGFPRINLFSAEPQFFANSLLPSLFAALFWKHKSRLATLSLTITSLAIGLTFSRGAFMAIIVSLVLCTILYGFKHQPVRHLFVRSALVGAGIVAAFGLLIISASVRYRNTPYIAYNTTVSMIDHLTLGHLRIAQKTVSAHVESATRNTKSFVPEGFVEASSNDRINAAELALDAWNDSPRTILFGVGMGNLGTYVQHHSTPQAPSNLTVYIWYILVLAELGITGLIGLILPVAYILRRIITRPLTPRLTFVFGTTTALMTQLWSFGSYINVMYCYVWIGIFVAIVGPSRCFTPNTAPV